MELPPHARRRGIDRGMRLVHRGITSACAEKSKIEAKRDPSIGNYLRMRGEEAKPTCTPRGLKELPPHARRRAPRPQRAPKYPGITSACAEKRVAPAVMAVKPRNYLRMRGEEASKRARPWSILELPPHARRRAGLLGGGGDRYGGNYLRMRGEEITASISGSVPRELPPHARRRAPWMTSIPTEIGITSACAEKRCRFEL